MAARYPLLSDAILAGASAQLRNMASNGGNLLQRTRCYYFYDLATPCNKRDPGSGCSAIGGYNRMHAILGASDNCIAVFPSDMCVALAALNARVNILNADGERSIAFADFHRLPGERPELDNNLEHGDLITSIDLPAESLSLNFSYLKLRDRTSYAFALVSVATALKKQGWPLAGWPTNHGEIQMPKPCLPAANQNPEFSRLRQILSFRMPKDTNTIVLRSSSPNALSSEIA